MMAELASPASTAALPREPGSAARFFVYTFAWAAPILVIGLGLVTAWLVVHVPGRPGIAAAAAVGAVYMAGLVVGFRGVRVLAARFTPPLPLPADFWNMGVVEDHPHRSSNWPIRLFPRRRPA